MELSDKPCLKKNIRLRNEKFGKLIVAAGLPMLCVNHDAVKLLDLADGQHTIKEIIDAVLLETQGGNNNLVATEVDTFFSQLNQLSLLG